MHKNDLKPIPGKIDLWSNLNQVNPSLKKFWRIFFFFKQNQKCLKPFKYIKGNQIRALHCGVRMKPLLTTFYIDFASEKHWDLFEGILNKRRAVRAHFISVGLGVVFSHTSPLRVAFLFFLAKQRVGSLILIMWQWFESAKRRII